MSVLDDYAELVSIATGYGCREMEEAEHQAANALMEIGVMRPIVQAAVRWKVLASVQGHDQAKTDAQQQLYDALDNMARESIELIALAKEGRDAFAWWRFQQ